jgi:glutaredoxin
MEIMDMVHVEGKNKGDIMLYAISTCSWCKKTKSLLNKLGVEYNYINVDLLEKSEKAKIEEQVKRWNPNRNYPTMVINNKTFVVGYREDEIKEALKL